MINSFERDYEFIQSLFKAKNTDNIIQILKDNDKIPQNGGCFDALKFFIAMKCEHYNISYNDQEKLYNKIPYYQNALLKLCITEKENIQNEFDIYKEKHKEVSAREQLKLEIIKNMLASGTKPQDIDVECVEVLVMKLLNETVRFQPINHEMKIEDIND